jgi:hypothetical protein
MFAAEPACVDEIAPSEMSFTQSVPSLGQNLLRVRGNGGVRRTRGRDAEWIRYG